MKVAVMGYGTVGSGVCEVIETHQDTLAKRTGGKALELARILDLREFPGDKHEALFTKDFNDILNDPEIQIVAETMGGVNPAFDFTMKLLASGKSVVTSNKELVAQKGPELLACAKAHNVNYLIEASVGGGIPIIRPMAQCLAANHIEGIAGILNGTTNFILTQMIEEDMSFADALALAQANGFAEKDPTADVEGHDACRKVCILASLAFGKHVYPSQVETEGISKITLEDVAYVASAGGVIKLLGQIKDLGGGKIAAFVGPAVVYNGSQLASVKGVFNAVLVRGDAVGDVCFYGQGAGKLPTASAVVADMADCAAHTEQRRIFGWGAGEEDYVVDYKTAIKMPFYVRVQGDETHIKQAFDNVKFLSRRGQPADEKAFITDEMTEEELERQLLTAGEQISISLLAMAIERMGFPVISLLGWQAGFNTNAVYGAARIKNIKPNRLQAELAKRNIVVVAGFQGLNRYDDLTTLGRGGSDTSAVAIAAALNADKCQIFTDVEGVYTADPRKVENAQKLTHIT